MYKRVDRKRAAARRHLRVRKRVVGTPDRPRLNVYRSLAHIYAQIIDDVSGHTLVAASSLDPEIKESIGHGRNAEAAKAVGKLVAKRAQEKGIQQVVFDRGGHLYHGRIAALADGAREGGLVF
ncbi:MAG: 50S ribosomal protein L18 [Bacillota bacterium]|nr:50S ribosomal protein L18 [Bacillota bacterium]HOB91640.1 50S ribosomal protein L18 [Bacillota bacterium]HPZ54442.1 50S ribosomal protein L18 [Bacillota bacterium]HQD17778.1 50S ribosomal protein L18 [Bacillota bacterium]